MSGSAAAGRVSPWNLANGLTAVRLALVPVFWVLLMHGDGEQPTWRLAAFVAFAAASVTDWYDGELARRWGQVTDLGKIADPIADKALIGAALVGLSALGKIPWWVTVVIVVREVGVTLLRLVVIRHGVIAASRGGKAKTMLQAVAIGLYVLPLGDTLHLVAGAVMGAAVVVTVVTGLDYVVRAVRLRRTSERTLGRRAAPRASGRPVLRASPPMAEGSAGEQPDVVRRATEVVRALVAAGTTVATAESLTGGLVGAALTSVAGSSAAYRGGVVSYATDLKHTLLDVDAGLLAERGAVDPDVAEAMARGVRERLGADYGLATTGVAGPDPQDGAPVGTVWVAVAAPDGVHRHDASTPPTLSREQVRELTVDRALQALLDAVHAVGPS